MSQMFRVRWDTSEAVVDEEEFELIKMMVQDHGADKEEGVRGLSVIIKELRKQGYGRSESMSLAHLARGVLIGQADAFPVRTD